VCQGSHFSPLLLAWYKEDVNAATLQAVQTEPGSREWAKREVERVRQAEAELGGLLPGETAAALLGVTRRALYGLVERGQVRRVELPAGALLYSGEDVFRRLNGYQGRPGRPRKAA
jgi:hypothetical protein